MSKDEDKEESAESSRFVSVTSRNCCSSGELIDEESIAAALVGTWDALFLQAWFEKNFDPLITARNFLKVVIRGLSNED